MGGGGGNIIGGDVLFGLLICWVMILVADKEEELHPKWLAGDPCCEVEVADQGSQGCSEIQGLIQGNSSLSSNRLVNFRYANKSQTSEKTKREVNELEIIVRGVVKRDRWMIL